MITLRDWNSKSVLESLGVSTNNVIVTADPAFGLEASTVNISSICEIKSDEKYCIISVRPWKFSDTEFEQKIAEICDYTIKKYGIVPLFLPMQQSFDSAISNNISEKLKTINGKILTEPLTIEQILGIINNAEFVIGMRLHTLIYSASVGVPVIGLVYDPKVGAFMDDVSQLYKQNVENIDISVVCGYIDEIIQSRDKISASLANIAETAKENARLNAKIAIDML